MRREFNPLLVKELRGRMRGARAFVVLTVYLLLMSCVTSIIYYTYSANARGPGSGLNTAYIGETVFATVVILELFAITAIAPSFTAGAISGERERRTYELLRTTLLPARKLVSGKLTAALAYTVLLILAAVPLESLAFVLGGVTVEDLMLAVVVLLVTAFTFSSIGLFYSSLTSSTRVATTLTYVTTLLTTIGIPVLLVLGSALTDPYLYGYSSSSLSWVVEAALTYMLYLGAGLSPITAVIFTKVALEEESAVWFFWMEVSSHRIPIPSAWIVYTVTYLGLALAMLLVAMLRVRRQARR